MFGIQSSAPSFLCELCVKQKASSGKNLLNPPKCSETKIFMQYFRCAKAYFFHQV